MRILVTGVRGFVGRHLVPALSAGGHEVLGVVRPGQVAPDGVASVEVDLATRGAAMPATDAVVHLAQANVSPVDAAGEMYAVNALSTLGLLEDARVCGAKRFVLASSGAVYGNGGRLTEADPLSGDSFYATTKIHAERFVGLHRAQMGTVVLRLFFPYGSGLPEKRLIADIASRVRDGRPVTLNAEGRPIINPVHVSDVAEAIVRALELPEDEHVVCNLAGPDACSIRDLAEAVGSLVGREPLFEDGGGASGDVVADIEGMRLLLGRDPLPLKRGLAMMIGQS